MLRLFEIFFRSKKAPKYSTKKDFSIIISLLLIYLISASYSVYLFIYVFAFAHILKAITAKPTINNLLRRNFYLSTPFHLPSIQNVFILKIIWNDVAESSGYMNRLRLKSFYEN